MNLHPVHQRLAELTVKNQTKGLTEDEMDEMNQCLKANVALCWEYAYLKNVSLLAKMVGDVNWQEEISLEIKDFNLF